MAPFQEVYTGHHQWPGWTDGSLVVYLTLSMDFSGATPDRVEHASLYQKVGKDLRPLANSAWFILPNKRISTVDRSRMKPNKATLAKVDVVRQLHAQDKSIAEIARVVGLTRQTVYRLLGSK